MEGARQSEALTKKSLGPKEKGQRELEMAEEGHCGPVLE